MENKVSVVIPIYNAEKFLEQCLSSVINQSYQNLEIILVNDGSTDNSKIICEKFKEQDNRIKLINKSNGGVSSARNEALLGQGIINGKYLAFMDSDDWLEKDYIKTLVQNLEDNSADLSICNYKWEKRNNKNFTNKHENKLVFNNNYEIVNEFFTANNFMGSLWCKLLKTELVKGLKFNENIFYGEDAMFLYEYAKRCKKAVYTNKKLYHYIKVKNSLSMGKINAKKLTLLNALTTILKDAQTNLPQSETHVRLWLFLICVELLYRIKSSKYKDDIIKNKLKQTAKENYKYFKLHKKELKTYRKFANVLYLFLR